MPTTKGGGRNRFCRFLPVFAATGMPGPAQLPPLPASSLADHGWGQPRARHACCSNSVKNPIRVYVSQCESPQCRAPHLPRVPHFLPPLPRQDPNLYK